jgi:hypothetical protein
MKAIRAAFRHAKRKQAVSRVVWGTPMNYLLSALAGIIGGVTIAVIGMLYSAATGGGLWTLPNSIGGILLGAKSGETRSFGVVTLIGVGFHMILSAAYGIATLYLGRQLNVGFVYVGVAVGLFVWLFNHFLIGQLTQGFRKHVQFNPVWLAAALHVLYGAVTGLVTAALVA